MRVNFNFPPYTYDNNQLLLIIIMFIGCYYFSLSSLSLFAHLFHVLLSFLSCSFIVSLLLAFFSIVLSLYRFLFFQFFLTLPLSHLGYDGPWIENYFIDAFIDKPLSYFRGFIPLFIQWVDVMVAAGDFPYIGLSISFILTLSLFSPQSSLPILQLHSKNYEGNSPTRRPLSCCQPK